MSLAAPNRRQLALVLGATAAGALAAGGRGASAASGMEFNSPYNFINIEKAGEVVTFNYSLVAGRMSAIDLSRPAFQVVPYTRYYYAAELVRPDPRRVLMAGLGAGGFNRLFNVAHPDARLVSVEIDPMIVRLAQEHTGFAPGPNDELVVEDARTYLRRSRDSYDWILLDAFDRNAQIPVHLTTREFYDTLGRRLAEGGLVLTNLHQGTRFFASQVLTIRAAFPDTVLVPVQGRTNVIAVASKAPAGSFERRLAKPAPELAARFREYGVDLDEIARNVTFERDYLAYLGNDAVVLTDDFAPVENLARKPLPDLPARKP